MTFKMLTAELPIFFFTVSKVVNKYGPQTRPALITLPHVRPAVKRERIQRDSSGADGAAGPVTGVEERLHNMESFLKIKTGNCSHVCR